MKNVKLGTLGDIFIGLTYRPDDVSANGTVVLRSSNIQEGQLDFADTIRVNCKIRENLFVKENDILMCSRNGSAKLVGKCTLIPKLNEDMTFGAFMTIIRTSHNAYLQHFFNSNAFRTQIKGSATTTINQITRKMLDDIDVPIFDTNEEKHIVETFDKLTRLIALRTEQLKKLDELVKSRFIELFIGKGYPTKTVDEVSLGKGEYGAQSASIKYDPTRPRYVRITDINDDGTLNDDVVASINPDDDEQYRLEYGDFMFARMGATVGKTYAFITGNQIFAGYLIRYKLNQKLINPRYLFWYTRLDEYWNWVKLNQSGAAQPGINAKKYGSLRIPVPPIEQQEQFATFVEQTDKSKLAVQQSIAELEELKKSLMQQYFG